jgi:hypothetical protein
MADISITVRAVGANSVSFETGAFAATDTLTYAALKAAILAFAAAQPHKVTGLKSGQLYSFLNGTYGSDAAALTEFAKKGGIIAVSPGNAATTAVAALKVAQSSFVALLGSIVGGSTVRVSLAASIDA